MVEARNALYINHNHDFIFLNKCVVVCTNPSENLLKTACFPDLKCVCVCLVRTEFTSKKKKRGKLGLKILLQQEHHDHFYSPYLITNWNDWAFVNFMRFVRLMTCSAPRTSPKPDVFCVRKSLIVWNSHPTRPVVLELLWPSRLAVIIKPWSKSRLPVFPAYSTSTSRTHYWTLSALVSR